MAQVTESNSTRGTSTPEQPSALWPQLSMAALQIQQAEPALKEVLHTFHTCMAKADIHVILYAFHPVRSEVTLPLFICVSAPSAAEPPAPVEVQPGRFNTVPFIGPMMKTALPPVFSAQNQVFLAEIETLTHRTANLTAWPAMPAVHAPLIVRGAVMGGASLFAARFTPADIPVIEMFAGALALAFDRITQFSHLQHQAEDLALINTINKAVNREADLDEIARILSNEIAAAFRSYGATLYLLDADKKNLQMQNLHWNTDVFRQLEKLIGLKIPLFKIPVTEQSYYYSVLESDRPRVLDTPAQIETLIREFARLLPAFHRIEGLFEKLLPKIVRLLDLEAVVTLPLTAQNETVGVLEIAIADRTRFSRLDLQRLMNIATPLTIAIRRRQAEESGAQSEHHFKTLFEHAADAILIFDMEEHILEANEEACRRLGYTRAELLNIHPPQLDTPAYAAKMPEYGQRLQQEGNIIVESEHLTKDGRAIPVEVSVRIVTFKGKPAMLAIARDITTRKRIEQQNRNLLAAEQEQRMMAETLQEISLALTAQTNFEQVLDEILQHAQHIVPHCSANIALIDEDTMRTVRYRAYHAGAPDYKKPVIRKLADFPLDYQVVQSRRPLVIPDVRQEPRWVMLDKLYEIRAHISVPIVSAERSWGLLRLDSDQAGAFSEADVRRLEPLANAAAIALENARLVDNIRRQAEQLDVLHQVSHDLLVLRDFDSLLRKIVTGAMQLFEADQGVIHLYNPERDQLEQAITVGIDGGNLRKTIQHGEGLSGRIWETGAPCVVANYDTWPHKLTNLFGKKASLMGAPIRQADEFMGVLNLRRDTIQHRPFSKKDAAFLHQFSDLVAIAIQNGRLFDETRRQTKTLTALYDISLAVGGVLDTRKLLEQLYRQVQNLMQPDSFGMILYDRANRQAEIVMAMEDGQEVSEVVGMRFPLDDSGLSGWVLRSRQSLLVNDLLNDKDIPVAPKNVTAKQVRSWLGVPLIAHENIIGVITIQAFGPDVFVEQDRLFLEAVSAQAAIAIENAHLFEQAQLEIMERKYTQKVQDVLYKISEAMHTARNLRELLALVHDGIQQLMHADNFYVALHDPATDVIEFPYFVDKHDEAIPKNPGRGLTRYILAKGEALLLTPEKLTVLRDEEGVIPVGTASVDWLGVPLKVKGRTIGVLAVQTYTESIRLYEKDKDILAFVSTQVAMAIQRKQAEEEIRRRNRELTSLNRIIAASVVTAEPEYILETTCRELAAAFEVPQAVAWLFDEKKTEAQVVAEFCAANIPSFMAAVASISGNNIFAEVLISKAPLVIEDVAGDPRLEGLRDLVTHRKIVSLFMLPLMIDTDVVGTVFLSTTVKHYFSPEQVALARRVSEQVSGVLARARLDKSHRLLSKIIEQTAESVVITDTQGRITYVNPAFETTSGRPRAEVLGKNVNLLKSGKHPPEFYRELWDALHAGKVWHGRFVNRKKDGSFYTDEATIGPVLDDNGRVVNYVSVQRNVTRELALEEQYHQSQKMDSLGRLTGGIAHDFNNLLTAINGFAELMQRQLPEDSPYRSMVGSILYSGQRAANLVRQLLAFSRKQMVNPQILDANTIVIEMDKMLQRIIGEHIEFKTMLNAELWQIKIDPSQLEQIIVNMLVNARDAMPDGGKLTIETANIVLDETYASNYLETEAGPYVLLSFSDTGIGMDEQVQSQIFEPFFTTKDVGKGTGLGLSTVFGIVKQNGGHIQVYSEVGMGTTFKVYLPRAVESQSQAGRAGQSGDMPGGTEIILLVEDEDLVRSLTARVLTDLGYTVLQACNGVEALQLLETRPHPVHLLLTDLVMPEMGGDALAKILTERIPGLKLVFMSGYANRAVMQHSIISPDDVFVSKPFGPPAIAQAVRKALDA